MRVSDSLRLLFAPVGPVAAAFGLCLAILSAIMGPVGGGKTTEAIAKIVRIGNMQGAVWDARRGCFVKKCRGAVVRDTYPNLDRTVIKSWLRWFPKDMPGARWSGEAPRTHSFTLGFGIKGTPGYFEVDHEVIFVAIGDHAVEDVLRGLELTWLWLNEMDLLPRSIVEIGIGRIGRYPSGELGACLFPQIIGDFNAPEEDNWTVDLIIEQKLDPVAVEAFQALFGAGGAGPQRPLIGFHRQPGGREDGAENLHNLPGGRAYYIAQAALMAPDKKRRMIDNRIGPIRKGTPVYPEFIDDLLYDAKDVAPTGHVRRFEANKRLPLLIGADQDICPGAVIAQLDPEYDQLLVLDELARIFEDDDGHIEISQMGGAAFGREVAARIQTRFPGHEIALAVCDPAGGAGERAIGHSSWRRDFQKGLGVTVKKAAVPGNELEPRLKAVRERLGARVPGRPRLIVHERCRILRKAFNSRYVWSRVSVGSGDGRFGSVPLKAQGYADVMNALEYLAFDIQRGISFSAIGDAMPRDRRPPVVVDGDYDMFGG